MEKKQFVSVKRFIALPSLGICLALLLAACGGGGGGTASVDSTGSTGSFTPSQNLANQCASPRPNTADVQGSAALEKSYLRSFIDESYRIAFIGRRRDVCSQR